MSDTRFNADLQGVESFTGQSFDPTNPLSTFNPEPRPILDGYRSSDRSDFRAIAAIATIEAELAEMARAPVAVIQPGSTSAAPFAPCLAPSLDTRGEPTPAFAPSGKHAARASKFGARMIGAMRRDHPLPLASPADAAHKPVRKAVHKPARKSARGRARRSPVVRKADGGDGSDGASGDGDGDGARRRNVSKPRHIPVGSDFPLSPWGERPVPRRGMIFVNASCDCWRAQFTNLACTACEPILLREVPKRKAVR